MNTITDIKLGLAEAHRDKSSNLYVRENRFEVARETSGLLLTAKTIENLVFDGLVPDVYPRIFSNLDVRALQASCCVSKACQRLVFEQNEQTRQKVDGIAFGNADWKALGLDIGKEPLIPPSLVNCLDKPDPVNPSQAVGDTHVLVLVPSGLTLKSLGVLVKSRFPGSQASGHSYIEDRILNQLSAPNEKSYWVLMTKEVILGTQTHGFETQERVIATFAKNAEADYVVPTALEAAVCILTHEFKSGEHLFGENPRIYTRCQDEVDGEPIFVGGSPSGLCFLSGDDFYYEWGTGVAVLRKS